MAVRLPRALELSSLGATAIAVGSRSSSPRVSIIGRDDRFIAYSNGTVLDKITKRMWAAKDNGYNINWPNAKSYCENYRGGGYKDWRMPTQDELDWFYDANKSRLAACDRSNNIHFATELIDISCCCVWAVETHGSDAAGGNYFTGGKGWVSQSNQYFTRALPVRSVK